MHNLDVSHQGAPQVITPRSRATRGPPCHWHKPIDHYFSLGQSQCSSTGIQNAEQYKRFTGLLHTIYSLLCSTMIYRSCRSCSVLPEVYVAVTRVDFNPLIATLKSQSNGPSYSNTVIGTLVVDRLHLVQRGVDWAGPQPAQAPPRCTKCNSPPINGQCTNFVLFGVAL